MCVWRTPAAIFACSFMKILHVFTSAATAYPKFMPFICKIEKQDYAVGLVFKLFLVSFQISSLCEATMKSALVRIVARKFTVFETYSLVIHRPLTLHWFILELNLFFFCRSSDAYNALAHCQNITEFTISSTLATDCILYIRQNIDSCLCANYGRGVK